MSFIYDDKKLIEELIKSAQDFESKFVKKSQVTAPVSQQSKADYFNLAKKLVSNLEASLTPSPNDVSTLSDNPQPLTVNNANSLGNFLNFVADNQIVVGGKRVAYKKGDASKPQGNEYLPINGDMSSVVDMGDQGDNAEFYVSKDLISKYLLSLQDLAQKNKNDILKIMVGKLIENVNGQLKTNIVKDTNTAVNPDTTLTSFPEVLDPTSNADGPKMLMFKDIQSPEALKSWVNSNQIAVKYEDQAGKSVVVKTNDPKVAFDWCVVIRTINNKAKLLLQNFSTTQELKALYQSFVNQVTKISGSFQGPDGKSCNLGVTGLTQPSGEGQDGLQNVSYNPNDPNSKGRPGFNTNKEKDQLNALMNVLPYQSEMIDFNLFKAFAETYLKIDPAASSECSHVIQLAMKMGAMYGKQRGQSTNQSVQDIQAGLKSPTFLTPYLLDLRTLLDKTNDIFMDLKSKFGRPLKDTPALKDKIDEQVGSSGNDASSLYGQNIMTVNEWESHKSEVERH